MTADVDPIDPSLVLYRFYDDGGRPLYFGKTIDRADAAEAKAFAAKRRTVAAKAQADTLMAVVEAIRPRAETEAKTLHETLSTLNESR